MDPPNPIPLVDLQFQHRHIAAEVTEGFERIIATGAFINGPDVGAFEQEFAAFCAVDHCVGVANGTDAIELALRACGIGPGHEVLLPANTFVATAEAVARAGATVGFVDCDPMYHLIDVGAVSSRIGSRTAAVIAVDLYGQVAPMEELAAVTADAGILLFEDAAQSQGASRHGRLSGSFGAAAATSFYPGKNLGAYGDGGAVLTTSADTAMRVRHLGNHGGTRRYEHAELGFNSRLDSLQAVVLRAKLARLAGWNDQRRAAAARYDAMLAGATNVVLPATLPGNEHVWHLYVVRVPDRDIVLHALGTAGIGAGIHYPVPVHLQPAFASASSGPGAFPVAELAAGEILSLPLFPGITEAQQQRVVDVLVAALP